MASSNYARLSEGLRLYRDQMRRFMGARLRAAYPSGDWFNDHVLPAVLPMQAENLRTDRARADREAGAHVPAESVLDIQHFNLIASRNWDAFDRSFTGRGVKNRVLTWMREVGDARNEWAHPPLGDSDPRDVDRLLDTCERILERVDAEVAKQVAALRAGDATPPPPIAPADEPTSEPPPASMAGKAQVGSLAPWREVITPHPDVQAGRYVKAEFAADLQQVADGRASVEYGDPSEFFRRTFVTADMRRLLTSVVERLRDGGGDPVYDLKTAFGGGKTHTMLAVYHLVRSPEAATANPDVQAIYDAAGGAPPTAQVAVLVGTHLDPNTPSRLQEQTGGVEIHTLWGEMAWQLAGMAGYQLVAEHDAKGASPGAAVLERLFELAGPSVVLIDELVAFLRSVPTGAARNSLSGNYDTHITFFQALTEAAKSSPRVVVLASIPESQIEYGGARGASIADQVSNIFQRIGPSWQPVSAQEAFEVVRRRLFGDVQDIDARDRTCDAFAQMYREGTDFPQECREPAYRERMRASYPIHPEIFERLYEDWATNIDRFQRTRGVLRLMADVIYRLWERGDNEPLIMPGSIPLYDSNVRQQLVGYLGDNWNGPVDADIDGESSEARSVERQQARFDRIQACRRLTRTIFLGSVPGKAHIGLEVPRVMLGAVEPGEGVATYGDALRTLQSRLSFLYGSEDRYWFDVRPNLNKVAADRIGSRSTGDGIAEIRRRMQEPRSAFLQRGNFVRVHIAPGGPGDVDDEAAARLVVLGPQFAHRRDEGKSAALDEAGTILESRGTTPRTYRNMLVFAVADADTMAMAIDDARAFLGWQSIASDGEAGVLHLDDDQRRQAERSRGDAGTTVDRRLQEAYRWMLVPEQDGTNPVRWNPILLPAGQLGSDAAVGPRASQKLTTDGLLITAWSPLLLKRELDKWLWADGAPHLDARRLWELLATYLYLPRLRDADVLRGSIENGVRSREYFGYADGVEGDHYRGLVFGAPARGVNLDGTSVLVRPEVAEAAAPPANPTPGPTPPGGRNPDGGVPIIEPILPPSPSEPTRFHGAVRLNPLRLATSAGQIGEEVVQHLASLPGAEVEVVLEIQVRVPGGIPENIARIVSENARALKFESMGLEEQ